MLRVVIQGMVLHYLGFIGSCVINRAGSLFEMNIAVRVVVVVFGTFYLHRVMI